MRDVVLLIPAYRPSPVLPELVERVNSACPVIVVDDGSGPEYASIFSGLEARQGVTVLRHAVNLGKGAALKTGFNHFLLAFPDAAGVVTADADGQHAVGDILNVVRTLSENPDEMILGVRTFSGSVPLRSRFGNSLTRWIFHWATGARITDTQTGLRGWPRQSCLASLPIPINGYDFELECLMRAHNGGSGTAVAIRQVPIETIYLDGNRASHFNPIRDSMRIYFIFIRYCGVSLMSAVIDSLTFYLVNRATNNMVISMIAGRTVATAVAFVVARNMVFHSDTSVITSLMKYLTLVVVMGFVAYNMLNFLHRMTGWPVVSCKLIAEGLLFLANFSIQRQIVFVRSKLSKADA